MLHFLTSCIIWTFQISGNIGVINVYEDIVLSKNFYSIIIYVKEMCKMLLEFLDSKIHRATITDSNLNYVGSITIDEDIMDAANIREWQKVDILNINNGERFQTYVIKGARKSKMFCVNGAAARKVQKGDKVIICSYRYVTEDELDGYKPVIVQIDENNNVVL